MNKLKSNGIIFLLAIATAFLSTGCTKDGDPDGDDRRNSLNGTVWICDHVSPTTSETLTFSENTVTVEQKSQSSSTLIMIVGTYTYNYPVVIFTYHSILGIAVSIRSTVESRDTLKYVDDSGKVYIYRRRK
jgi:hypothetical protein